MRRRHADCEDQLSGEPRRGERGAARIRLRPGLPECRSLSDECLPESIAITPAITVEAEKMDAGTSTTHRSCETGRRISARVPPERQVMGPGSDSLTHGRVQVVPVEIGHAARSLGHRLQRNEIVLQRAAPLANNPQCRIERDPRRWATISAEFRSVVAQARNPAVCRVVGQPRSAGGEPDNVFSARNPREECGRSVQCIHCQFALLIQQRTALSRERDELYA